MSPDDDWSSFDCEDMEINEFIHDDAIDHIEKDLATVYAIKNHEDRVLAYATLSMSAIRIKADDAPYPQVPALLLGRLGVDKDARYDTGDNKNY